MSNIVEYSFGDKKFGTTINAVTFEILVNGVAKPLTNTTIEAVFRRCNNDGTVMKTLTIGDGITVVDELGGKFKF
ncbi:MAG: hypothetical protein GY928_13525, partial [Colwellia sp.]|nr:hypothetical protein [Colwellia sp.]